MSSIVKISRPGSNAVTVDWAMGTTCNYACSYCPSTLHDGKWKWPSLDIAKQFVEALKETYQAPVQFILSGGEPTLMPGFAKLLRIIKETNPENTVSVITNGSRTIRWWRTNKHNIDTVILTTHIEQCDADHLRQVCQEYYNPGINGLYVLVPMHPDRWEECIAVAETLTKDNAGYVVSLKQLRVDFGATLYPYTVDQTNFINKYGVFNSFYTQTPNPAVTPADNRYVAHWDDGTKTYLNCNSLINTRQNVFTGMNCYIGLEKIFVNFTGEIKSGSWCPQGKEIFGSIYNPKEISWPRQAIVCKQPRCMNATDMRTTKHHD
jgi:organic radical activating enzyme